MNPMNDNQQTLEVRGEDIESAISAGLRQLGLQRDQVTVQIVDEGRKGFLGLGGREAIVKLSPIPRPEPVTAPPPEAEAAPLELVTETAPSVSAAESPATEEEKPAPSPAAEDAEPDEEEQIAIGIVQELLEMMEIDASLEIQQTPPDDLTGRRMTVLNISGDEDVNRLIGSRGQVLNNLQYLARLMAGHAIQGRANFLLDVNSYRGKREQALASLARRMAQKAARRGQPVTLEPMTPYERRIIHMTLRDEDEVYTQSTGEGNRRRVRIYPREYADD